MKQLTFKNYSAYFKGVYKKVKGVKKFSRKSVQNLLQVGCWTKK